MTIALTIAPPGRTKETETERQRGQAIFHTYISFCSISCNRHHCHRSHQPRLCPRLFPLIVCVALITRSLTVCNCRTVLPSIFLSPLSFRRKLKVTAHQQSHRAKALIEFGVAATPQTAYPDSLSVTESPLIGFHRCCCSPSPRPPRVGEYCAN